MFQRVIDLLCKSVSLNYALKERVYRIIIFGFLRSKFKFNLEESIIYDFPAQAEERAGILNYLWIFILHLI